MNRSRDRRSIQTMSRVGRSERGQSTVEMGLFAPILVLILLLGMDFGRMFYAAIAVSNAARAGAQYGSQSLITAADSAGMIQAARTDGATIPGLASPGLSVTASQCTCKSGSSVTACPAAYCSSDASATYVIVTATASFQTYATYPALPSPVPLSGRAVMQVE